MKSILVVLLVSLFGIIQCADPKATLIVYKTLLTKQPVATQDVVVNIKIFNVGESTAYDLNLSDEAWLNKDEKSVELANGLTQVKWDKLAPGTNISHSYVVKPTVNGVVYSRPARVLYRNTPKGSVHSIYSSDVQHGGFWVESFSENAKRTAPHYKEWSVFVVLAGFVTVPAYLIWSGIQQQFK